MIEEIISECVRIWILTCCAALPMLPVMKAARVLPLLLLLAFVYSAQAGMMGDPVTSILHTAYAGSWPYSSATVGAGVEFTQTYNELAVLGLDISDTSFTLTFVNNTPPTTNNPTGSFNLGLDGFEFTDFALHFANVTFANSTGGFPANSITSTSVTATDIHVFMNEPSIPGSGTTWTATWNVTFAPALSIAQSGQNVIVSWPAEAVGYTLQNKSTLTSGIWADITTSTNHVTLPATNSTRFFRLIKH